MTQKAIESLLAKMTGHSAPLKATDLSTALSVLNNGGWGFSQFNEVLLMLGYYRVSESFFQYIVNGTSRYIPTSRIDSYAALESAITRFRILAILRFGSIVNAFKTVSGFDAEAWEELILYISHVPVDEYKARHAPICPVSAISGSDTYYLGYLIQAEICRRLKVNEHDAEAKADAKKRDEIVAIGMRNHEAYLASDHLDVYVATSMRTRDEYVSVNKIAGDIFGSERLKPLNLRFFDPTQAYCADRIDKGLSEALMLKRAQCTLYLAQETDTLGKNSELASTLAQGKAVIAFVPEFGNDADVIKFIEDARASDPNEPIREFLIRQLKRFCPQLAWEDRRVQDWLRGSNDVTEETIRTVLIEHVRLHYDKRANELKNLHPLGIQVNLETGVANGVLVARTTAQCADLIYRVATNSLEFDVVEKEIGNCNYIHLQERTTGSVFRVVSGDPLLTNSFWNFYTEERY